MSKRLGTLRRGSGAAQLPRSLESTETQRAGDASAEPDAIAEVSLPRDHPKWARDRFTVSKTTLAVLSKLRPLVIRAFGFWDHRNHRLEIDDATILVDVSGAYRSA